ncbi:MAG TPA: SDR family oxidoreductase [Myxococcota bacterium]|nr:SDR family oxidoreductase [Myxococcota bacterium]
MTGALSGQVAIVTGGGGNIGGGVCRALAKAGATVVALDRNPSGADAAARRVTCDVTDPAACEAAVGDVVREFGGVDTLVNAAQRFRAGIPFVQLRDDDLRVSFESGPMATLRMMQLCYPHMKARGGGAIINFASGAGTQGMIGAGAYAAAKEAIRGLTKVAALEWGREGIRVNVICPVATADPNAAWVPDALEANPMGRIGDPEKDIGAAVVYLAGPGSYVNGRTLHVDGGIGTWR